MADLHLVEHGNGDYSIGAEIDGTYVPFATVTGARVAQVKDRATTLAERGETADDEEQKRLDAAHAELPVSAGSKSSSKSSSKPKGEEG